MAKRWILRMLLLSAIISFGAIALPTILAWGKPFYILVFRPYEPWQEKPSPDGSLVLAVNVREPDFHPFGSHEIELLVRSRDRVLGSHSTRLRNDGANLHSGNLQVRWLENRRVEICLKGEEQKPEGLSVAIDSQRQVQFQVSPAACRQ